MAGWIPSHASPLRSRSARVLPSRSSGPVIRARRLRDERRAKLAGLQKRPPREIAASSRRARRRGDRRARGGRRPWIREPVAARRLARRRRAPDRRGRGHVRSRSAASDERIQVEMVSANPTARHRRDGRNGAYGDSVARLLAFAGHEVEREYYYNDAGAQMELFHASVEAVRRGGGAARGRLRRRVRRGARGASRRSRPRCSRGSRPRSSASASTSTRGSGRASSSEIPEAIALLDTFEDDDALWARTSAYGDDKDRVLVRTEASRRTSPPTPPTSDASTRAASIA